MDLPEALYRGVTGRSPTTEGSWRFVVSEVGKAYPHATKPPPGLSARTWQRIRADPAGRRLRSTVRALVDVQRALRFRTARRRTARGKRIRFRGEVTVSGDTRTRVINVSNWIKDAPPDAMMRDGRPLPSAADLDAAVIAHMQAGEHDQAARLLLDALSARVQQEVFVDEVEWARQLDAKERGPGE